MLVLQSLALAVQIPRSAAASCDVFLKPYLWLTFVWSGRVRPILRLLVLIKFMVTDFSNHILKCFYPFVYMSLLLAMPYSYTMYSRLLFDCIKLHVVWFEAVISVIIISVVSSFSIVEGFTSLYNKTLRIWWWFMPTNFTFKGITVHWDLVDDYCCRFQVILLPVRCNSCGCSVVVSARAWQSEGPWFDFSLGQNFSDRPAPGSTRSRNLGTCDFPSKTKTARQGVGIPTSNATVA